MRRQFIRQNKIIGLSFLLYALLLVLLVFLKLETSSAKTSLTLPIGTMPKTASLGGITLVPIAEVSKKSNIVDLAFTADGRLFVVKKDGRIWIVQANGILLEEPFLDISAKVQNTWEQGMLGLAFHPEYEDNGYFYVTYSNSELANATVISRFQVSVDNPNVADDTSELILLEISQPHPTHQAGDLAFGPAGYLYMSSGDGGPPGDPENRAQNGALLLGKILRLDVDNPDKGRNYGIPADNPFVDDPEVRDEIWALGLRNPWRFSFDRETGDMYIADVGESTWEEINFEPANSSGGLNYGWSCYQGKELFEPEHCNDENVYTFPVAAYWHQGGRAVIGGFIYRGSQYSRMQGLYLFSDYVSGKIFSLQRNDKENWFITELSVPQVNAATFGEGPTGEIYVADASVIYHIQDSSAAETPRLYLPLITK